MARIPTIQRRATLPTTTGVPAAPVVLLDDKTGQSLQAAGQVVADIGENQLRARADAMVTQSFVNATLKMDELKESIDTNKILSWEENDPGAVAPTADPEDVKARMAQIYETASEGLSPYGREKFDKDYSMLSAKGQIEIRREQVARDNAELEAHNLAVLDTLVKGSAKDGTDAVWLASLKKGIDSIDSLEVNRQIGPKKAEKLRQEFRTQMDKVKGDRLNENVVIAAATGIRNVDLDEESDAAAARLAKLDAALKEAVEFGAISRKMAQEQRIKFLSEVDAAMANQQIGEDPAKFLKLEKNSKYLPNLESKQRSIYAIRAQNLVDRAAAKVQTQANARAVKFRRGFKAIIEDASTGAKLSADLLTRISDEEIDAHISDPEERATMKAVREDAIDGAMHLEFIAGKHPSQIMAMEKRLVADTERVRTIPGMALQDQRQLAAFRTAKARDIKLRNADPAQYVITNNDDVSANFTEWNRLIIANAPAEDIAGAYANYAASLVAAYALSGMDSTMRRKLPKSFVKQQVAFIETEDTTPEQIAERFKNLSQTMGKNDWRFMLGEMQANGLSKEASALAVVEDPRARQTLAGIIRDGGMKTLNGILDKKDPDLTKDIDTSIAKKMENMIQIAGTNNLMMVNTLLESARLLARGSVMGGDSVGDAVEKAIKIVVEDQYQVIRDGKLKGIVPKGSIERPRQLMYGLSEWLKNDENMKNVDLPQITQGANDDQKKLFLRQNAQWTLTPDGESVALATALDTPVNDINGVPIVVPISSIQMDSFGARSRTGKLQSATQTWERSLGASRVMEPSEPEPPEAEKVSVRDKLARTKTPESPKRGGLLSTLKAQQENPLVAFGGEGEDVVENEKAKPSQIALERRPLIGAGKATVNEGAPSNRELLAQLKKQQRRKK